MSHRDSDAIPDTTTQEGSMPHSPQAYGRGNFVIQLLASQPLYPSNAILTFGEIEDDENIPRTEEPPVNANSRILKGFGTEREDALNEQGLQLLQAGIGDCDAGPSLLSLLQAVNLTTGHEIIPIHMLTEAGVDLSVTFHASYGGMSGHESAIVQIKPFVQELLGVRVSDFLVLTHGGRADVSMSLRAMAEPMRLEIQKRGGDPSKMKALVVVKTWGTYFDIIVKNFGEDAYFPLVCENGVPDPAEIDRICKENPEIGCVVFCNPNNPTGDRVSSHVAADLVRVLHERRLFVVEDAIYASLQFESAHRSVLRAAASMAHGSTRDAAMWVATHSSTLVGWGKSGLSGMRHYIAVIPSRRLRSRYVGEQGALYGPANALAQYLMLTMLKNGDHTRTWNEINNRRMVLADVIADMADELHPYGIKVEWSGLKGGFYTWLRFVGIEGMHYLNHRDHDKTINKGRRLTLFLVDKAGVVATPDEATLCVDPEGFRIAFGMMNEHKLRLMGKQMTAQLIELAKANGRTAQHVRAVPDAR